MGFWMLPAIAAVFTFYGFLSWAVRDHPAAGPTAAFFAAFTLVLALIAWAMRARDKEVCRLDAFLKQRGQAGRGRAV